MVRGKFRVDSYQSTLHQQQLPKVDQTDAKEAYRYEFVEKRTIILSPVYSSDPTSENHTFWQASPSGRIELGTVNPEAWKQFELGKEYYIDFTIAG